MRVVGIAAVLAISAAWNGGVIASCEQGNRLDDEIFDYTHRQILSLNYDDKDKQKMMKAALEFYDQSVKMKEICSIIKNEHNVRDVFRDHSEFYIVMHSGKADDAQAIADRVCAKIGEKYRGQRVVFNFVALKEIIKAKEPDDYQKAVKDYVKFCLKP